MRKVYLLPLLFFVALISCKEEEVVPIASVEAVDPAVHKQLQGTWKLHNLTNSFYDKNGNILQENTFPVDAEMSFDGDILTFYDLKADTVLLNPYTLYREEGKNYIRVDHSPSGYTINEISTLSETTLLFKESISLTHDFNGGVKGAVRYEVIKTSSRK